MGSPWNTPKISNLPVIACTQRPHSVCTASTRRSHSVFIASMAILRREGSSCSVFRARTWRSHGDHSVLWSVVVRRASTFDVYTLETTFVIRFWWNLVRMFDLTISRQSSNMGHVGSKTRSPGQILGNSCLHSRGHICDPLMMKLGQNVCIDNI